MSGHRRGDRRSARVRRGSRLLVTTAVVVCLAGAVVVYREARRSTSDSTSHGQPARSPAHSVPSVPVVTSARTASSSPATATATQTRPAPSSRASHPAGPAVLTAGGMWWGVDSSGPITAAAIDNVRGWYQGATPQFWGRYVSGHFAVTSTELAFARSRHIYVYLLVNDRNCSHCVNGDVCGHDKTAVQARADALEAIKAAGRVGVKRGAVLFKDIE